MDSEAEYAERPPNVRGSGYLERRGPAMLRTTFLRHWGSARLSQPVHESADEQKHGRQVSCQDELVIRAF